MAQLIHGTTINGHIAIHAGNLVDHSIATTTYVNTQIANLVNSAPAALDTLNELAAALGNDASFATTINNSLSTKLTNVTGNSGAYDLNTSGQHAFFRFSQGQWSNAPVSGNYSHVLSVNGASDNRTVQVYLGDVPGYLWWRPNQGGTWHPWERILTSNNFNSWAPTLTGTGASGTWSINVSGSAGSVAWTNVSSRPTALSQFTNDLGNYGGFLTSLPSHNHDDRYYTESESDGRYLYYRGVNAESDFQAFQDTAGEIRFDQINDFNNLSNRPSGYQYGGVLSMRGDNFGFQLWGSHTGDFFYKTQWSNDNYTGWRQVITSLNIGSQSVSFASSSSQVYHYASRTDGTWYNAVWAAGNPSHMYSADSVQIRSSDGAIRANIFYDNQDTSYYVDPHSTSELRNLYLGAHDSGEATLLFGENSSSWYGIRWYWDSGYNFYWYGRNAGSDTLIMNYTTNDNTYLKWHRHFHMNNYEINYLNQVHFNDNVRLYQNGDDRYLNFKWGNSGAGGMMFWDGDSQRQGYVYGSGTGSFGLLDSGGSWKLRVDTSDVEMYGTQYLTNVYAYIIYDRSNSAYYLDPASQSKLYLLGLGGAYPDAALSVSGTAHVDGTLYLGGTAGTVNSWGTRTTGGSGYWRNSSRDVAFNNEGYGSTWTFAISSAGAVTLNRHIDANTTWGSASATTIFMGWYGGKIMLGNNNDGAHDWANAIGGNSIISTNKHHFYKGAYIKNNVDGAEVLAVDGVNGRLFTVTDAVLDTIYSVNTIAGLPILEIMANNTVKIGKYGANSITISNSRIAINSDTVDTNFPFYVSDRSTAGSRYTLANPGMGFNLADNYAQLQLYGPSGAYIDFVTAANDYSGRIIWASSKFTISGAMWGDMYNASGASYATQSWVQSQGYLTSAGSYLPYGNWTGSSGLNDYKLYLRTNGDNNHYLWNAADDWEELNAYEGTGFRITSVGGTVGVLYVYGSSNGGYTYSPYSFRAPIFYDSDNTSYYLDPNSTTSLRTVGSWRSDSSSWDGEFSGKIQYHSNHWYFQSADQWIWRNAGGANVIYGNQSGDLTATGSMRAPIFYDTNDTAYYLNPAGGSRLRNLYVGDSGDDWSDPGGWGTQVRFSNGPHVRFVLHARTPGIEAGMYVHTPDQVYIGSYTSHNVNIMRGGNRRLLIEDGRVYSDVYMEASGSMRAPIFYDSNDTNYYVDPNSSSRVYHIHADYLSIGQGLNTSYRVITNGDYYANGGGNFWAEGRFKQYRGSGTWHDVIDSGNIGSQSVSYASSAGNADTVDGLHASSFTRKDTSGQYLKAYYEYGSYLTSERPVDLVDQGLGGGGLRVDFMHPSYTGSGGWNHVITWSGYNGYNMYQLGGHYDGGTGTDLWVRSEANHGRTSWTSWRKLLNSSNYTDYTFQKNAWNGNIYIHTDGRIYGTIFYDANDDGYYLNPNSDSNLWRFTEATLNRHSLNSRQTNSPWSTRSAQGTLYQTGAMGWGQYDFNVIASNWGSGFFDTWSNPANAPGGSSHYVGMQAFHYNNSDSARFHGWQMACAQEANNRWFWRSAWDTPRSWVEMIHSGNIGSQSVSYASSAGSVAWDNVTSKPGIYLHNTWHGNTYLGTGGDIYCTIIYDSNNSAYYVDPNGTSRMGDINANYLRSYGNARVDSHLYMDQNYGSTIVGVYASTRYQGVWAMGDAYKIAGDGTNPGNLYGLTWSHPNTGGEAGYLSNHGLIVMMYGTAFATLSDTIWCRGDIIAFSDARVKTNIQRIENPIDKVMAIRGVTFTRTDVEDKETRHAGVIAQEVLEVLPEVVNQNKDNGHYSVAYGNLSALLIEAIKEQQQQIEELKAEVKKLRGE